MKQIHSVNRKDFPRLLVGAHQVLEEFRLLESQRDCVTKPRVARHELPWGNGSERENPNGVSPLVSRPPLPQPRWGCCVSRLLPRVARASQPWAVGRNPFGIGRLPKYNLRPLLALGFLFGLVFITESIRAQVNSPLPRSVDTDPEIRKLATEVHAKGSIIYSGQSGQGDWDLFVMRPDGSARRNLTRTREFNEGGARFSPDGSRLLYYRMPKGEVLDNNKYGTYDLVVAKADGAAPMILGNGFSWASWNPEGSQIACLSKEGIRIVELATRSVVRKLDRKGIVEQLIWSPDGKWLVGTANGLGEHWAIGRMNALTGELNRVSDGDCFNCTPDWFPDTSRVIYSKGHPRTEGWAQLWCADGEGKQKRMLYGEIERHIYGGALSPDGDYILFTKSREDLGKVDNSSTSMALMRLKDAPIIGGKSEVLRKQYPQAKSGPVLELSWGWEPHWTAANIDFKN